MQIVFEIIIIVLTCFLVDLFTYKYIRYLDKKERIKLTKRETEYLQKMLNEMNKPVSKDTEESEINLLDL